MNQYKIKKTIPKYDLGVQKVYVPPKGNASDVLADTSGGIGMGSQIGGMFGPEGSLIGAGAGAVGGTVYGMINKQKMDAANRLATGQNAYIDNQNKMYGATPEWQQNLYGNGTEGLNNSKQIEVEGNELILRRQPGNKFKVVQDFANGKSHEEGGEPTTAEHGDIIMPKNKRKQTLDHIKNQDWMQLDALVSKLPTDTGIAYGVKGFRKGTKSLRLPKYGDGTSGIDDDYNKRLQTLYTQHGGNIPQDALANEFGNDPKAFQEYAMRNGATFPGNDGKFYGADGYIQGATTNGINDWMKKKNTQSVNTPPFMAAQNASQNNTPSYQDYKPWINDAFGNGGTQTTPSKTGTPPIPASEDKGGGVNWSNVGNNVVNALPTIYNLSQGMFGKTAQVNPNYIRPDMLQYRDMSNPLRAKSLMERNADVQTARNMSGGNANVFANSARAARNTDFQNNAEINLNENNRQFQTQQYNNQITNNAKAYNAGELNRVTDLNTRAIANKRQYLEAGLTGASGLNQYRMKDNNQQQMDQKTLDLLPHIYSALQHPAFKAMLDSYRTK